MFVLICLILGVHALVFLKREKDYVPHLMHDTHNVIALENIVKESDA